MPRKYPLLTPQDVRDIAKALGFTYLRTKGSHEYWVHAGLNGQERHLTIDLKYAQFFPDRIETMITQCGVSWRDFYCATSGTARKVNLRANPRTR